MISYGFDPTYWFSSDTGTAMVAMTNGMTAMRFMAVDLPRNTVGDTLTVWVTTLIASTGSAVSNTVVLADAANLALTTACVLLTASLM